MQIIRREIEPSGMISFARFMDLALFCPVFGYYERRGPTLGRQGDFYTNVSVGCLFGELLAFQCADWLAGLPGRRWQIVEAGAHDGQLAVDMLAWLHRWRPALLEGIEYWILEPSRERQCWQQATLEKFAGQVRWAGSIEQLPGPVTGVILSNELLDAMPVRRLGWDAAAGRWFEWAVGIEGEQFAWRRQVLAAEDAMAQLRAAALPVTADLLAVLPDGFSVDLCPEAARWWQRAAGRLGAGRLLTIDYGLTAAEFLTPERPRGTLRAYHRHHVSADPLANVGEQDLTAHVNFGQIQAAGEAAGLCTEGLLSQAQFLTRIARQVWDAAAVFGEWSPAQRRQFQTLTHPAHLGRPFRVLLQRR